MPCFSLKLTPDLLRQLEDAAAAGAPPAMQLVQRSDAAGTGTVYVLVVGGEEIALTYLAERAGHVDVYRLGSDDGTADDASSNAGGDGGNGRALHAVGSVQAKLQCRARVTDASAARYRESSRAAGELQRARHSRLLDDAPRAAVAAAAKRPRAATKRPRAPTDDASDDEHGASSRTKVARGRRALAAVALPAAEPMSKAAKPREKAPYVPLPWQDPAESFVVLVPAEGSDSAEGAGPPSGAVGAAAAGAGVTWGLSDATAKDVTHFFDVDDGDRDRDCGGGVGGGGGGGGGGKRKQVRLHATQPVWTVPAPGAWLAAQTGAGRAAGALLVQLADPAMVPAALARGGGCLVVHGSARGGGRGRTAAAATAVPTTPTTAVRVAVVAYDPAATPALLLAPPASSAASSWLRAARFGRPCVARLCARDLCLAAGMPLSHGRSANQVRF